MEFNAFDFFISIISFVVMFSLFYFVVIKAMEEAVMLRRKRVTSRLDEIRTTLKSAEDLEEEIKLQFSKLDEDKAEMRAATNREITRIREHLQVETEHDAQHLVAKTQRELDKNRHDTLVALNRQLSDLVMCRVPGVIGLVLDSQARHASATQVLEKVGVRG